MNIHRGLRSPRAMITVVGFIAATVVAGIYFMPSIRAMLSSPAERLYREGQEFAAEGRLPEAVLSYRQAVETDPFYLNAQQALSDAYFVQGRTRMAERYRGRLAELKPGEVKITPLKNPDANPLIVREWITPVSESTPTGLAVLNDVLIVAFEDGTIAGLGLDGAVKWQTQLPVLLTSAPGISNNSALVGGQDGALYALGLADGTLQWRVQTSAPVYAVPLAVDGRVFCASGDGSLYALDESTGDQLWRFQTGGALMATPAMEGDLLYFGSTDGKIYALEASSGAPVWQDGILTSGPVESTPLVMDGRVMAGSGDGRLYALAAGSGGEYWRYPTGDAVYAAPVVVDGTIYISSSANALHTVDWLTGKRIWKHEFSTVLRTSPLLVDDLLIVAPESDSHLYILDRLTGVEYTRIDTGDWTTGGVWQVDEQLIVAGKDGSVLSYRILAQP